MLPNYCSPGRRELYDKTGTCFNETEIESIAKLTNIGNDIENVKRRFKNDCGDYEACIADKTGVGMKAFVPKRREEWIRDNNAWLSNIDIENVLEGYEMPHLKEAKFGFLGVAPMDFQEKTWGNNPVNPCFKDTDLLVGSSVGENGVKNVAAVLNTSYSYQQGQHWVCFFICFDKESDLYGCYYFDSTNQKVPKEVESYIDKVSTSMNRILKKKPKFYTPKTRLQYGSTECGMFCINIIRRFIFSYLTKVKREKMIEESLNKVSLDDNIVYKDRYLVFRPITQEDVENARAFWGSCPQLSSK